MIYGSASVSEQNDEIAIIGRSWASLNMRFCWWLRASPLDQQVLGDGRLVFFIESQHRPSPDSLLMWSLGASVCIETLLKVFSHLLMSQFTGSSEDYLVLNILFELREHFVFLKPRVFGFLDLVISSWWWLSALSLLFVFGVEVIFLTDAYNSEF